VFGDIEECLAIFHQQIGPKDLLIVIFKDKKCKKIKIMWIFRPI
jgi:hypothetical protein